MIPANKSDIEILHKINKYIMDKYPGFNFKIDNGLKETAILILDNGSCLSGACGFTAAMIKDGSLFVPDMLDFNKKIIIEYEEESKPHRGVKIVKRGHFEESKRDTNRDYYYNLANFKLCKIWESLNKEDWQKKIDDFLNGSNERAKATTS